MQDWTKTGPGGTGLAVVDAAYPMNKERVVDLLKAVDLAAPSG